MNKLFWSTICFLLLGVTLFAQQKYTISGHVKDALSGEDIIGASIFGGNIVLNNFLEVAVIVSQSHIFYLKLLKQLKQYSIYYF